VGDGKSPVRVHSFAICIASTQTVPNTAFILRPMQPSPQVAAGDGGRRRRNPGSLTYPDLRDSGRSRCTCRRSGRGAATNKTAAIMDSSFGVLDGFAFVVFAVLIAAGVIIVVSLGQLPGRLARKWGHPQAAAINAMGWVGMATGGLLWPVAFIWAFVNPSRAAAPQRPVSDDEPPP